MPRVKRPPMTGESTRYSTRAVNEHGLWVSVLDRAIMDYTLFFDYVVTKLRNIDCNSRVRKNVRNAMRRDLDSLRWFFFEEAVVPYNLSWIAEFCFDGDSDFLDKVRKRVQEKHYSNLVRYQHYPEFEMLIKQYKETGLATDVIDCDPHRKLRVRVDLLH